MTTTATNVTISWDTSSSEASGALQWGNSTAVVFENSSIGTGTSFHVYLNYLEPQTKYYFDISAGPTAAEEEYPDCWDGGTYDSSWTTATDSITTISGYVYGPTSSSWAPANVPVYVSCAASPSHYDDVLTNSLGYYSMPIEFVTGQTTGCAALGTGGSGAYMLWFDFPGPGYNWPGSWDYWPGHWNETLEIWAPQIVDVYVPSNYISGYMPTLFDYTNAPAAQGYTDFNAATNAEVSESYTYSWSAGAQVYGISGGVSGSQTSSDSWSWGSSIAENEGTLCYAEQYVATGTALFNAIDRHWSFNQTYFDGQNGNFCANIPGFTVPAPYILNSTAAGAYYLPGPPGSVYQSGLQDVALWKGEQIGNESGFTASGSVQTGLQFGVSLSFDLPGTPSVSATESEAWSQGVSHSQSWSFAISGESQTSVSCYNVLGMGGSQSNNDAVSIAIYYWQGYTETVDGTLTPFCN